METYWRNIKEKFGGKEMKERIVIDCEDILFSCLHDYADNVGVINYKLDRKKVEKYPTSWEELKELCKKINSKIVNENAMYESQIIIDTDKGYFGFYYYPTGRIDIVFKSAYSTNHTVARKRTIPQTWAFIKSLIGEE